MLSIVVGETNERASHVQKILTQEIKKGKQLVTFSDASFQKETVLSYTSSGDMFGTTYVVHLSRVGENANGLDLFLNDTAVLLKSETLFVVEENELGKDLKKVFEDAGVQITEIKSAKANFFGGLNAFQLVDAYNLRDKKNAWVLYLKLIDAGTSAEEIAGAMIWNFKNLALYFSVSKPNPGALDMKPFVFSKVAAASKNFSKKEIADKSFALSSALHNSHRGKGDSATLLELFILQSL